MQRANPVTYLTIFALLVAEMPAGASGEATRMPFGSECLYRTPPLQDSNDQGGVRETLGAGRVFGIFINTTLYGQIAESIGTYMADLESDGWQVVLYAAEGGTSQKSEWEQWTSEDFVSELEAARQLRDLLKNEHHQGMAGCILIGELPAGWVEAEAGSGTGNPVDLFFRDMDSQWDDTDGNGLLDNNLPVQGDCKPEIWMGRLYASSLDGDEVLLMRNYFRKNHAYRIGELTLPKRALDYVDDDFAGAGFFLRGVYDEITQVNDGQITTASDYLARLSEGYELVRVSVHGYGWGHGFLSNAARSDVLYWDVINHDPCCFFYDVYSCGTFGWWIPDYIDGWYVFSASYGLASWGLCGYGSAGVFYDALEVGGCLGDAQLQHSNYLATEKSFLPGDEVGTFGLFGDPTLALRQLPSPPAIVYVDSDAVGDGSGRDWANAHNSLQDALAAASWGTEIHVAQGIHKPDQGVAVSLDDRAATFQLRNGVVIKGAYAGFGEPDPNLRDVHLYETILSGDIGIPDVNSDNARHVVTAKDVGAAAALDGFTITGGCANSSDVNGCGGGIYAFYSSPNIVDCNIVDNYAKSGGGMYIERDCTPALTNCRFSGNSATDAGGMANRHYSRPTLNNCIFNRNRAQSAGGGMYNNYYCRPLLTNCTLIDNSAHDGGGMYSICSDPKLTDCAISDNSAGQYGGGLHNEGGTMILANCIVSGNSAPWGAGMMNNSSKPCLRNCTFSANRAWGGGGLFNCFTTAILTNCIMWGDRPDEISDYVDAATIVSYSDIEGGWSGEGEFNINVNPEFADAESGDCHLKSQAGRWNDSTKTWETDEIDSPCIDTGDPLSPVGEEPEPNGGQINMGAYGGTAEASKSR